MIVDNHVHLDEFSEDDVEKFSRKFVLVGVASNIESSLKIIALSRKYDNVIPSVGVHPWNVGKVNIEEVVKEMERIILENDVRVIGEVGLDKKFVPETFDKQLEFFKKIVNLAREYELILNLHSPNAWREVFSIIVKNDINRAYFHWYTGDLNLLKEIEAQGYFIGVNPAAKIQKKHLRVIEEADISIIITESDGPYNYRGIRLDPTKITELISIISRVKGESERTVERKVEMNWRKLMGIC